MISSPVRLAIFVGPEFLLLFCCSAVSFSCSAASPAFHRTELVLLQIKTAIRKVRRPDRLIQLRQQKEG
jgi:hypothetical protein